MSLTEISTICTCSYWEDVGGAQSALRYENDLTPPQLSASGLLGNTELSVGAAVACFLAQEGADINYANHKGKSPLDLVADSAMQQLIKSFSEKHR